MTDTAPTLSHHFVAFLDLLGFATMVEDAAERHGQGRSSLLRLREVHEQTRARFERMQGYTLFQFSDSIVVARRFERHLLQEFLSVVADYQRSLLERRLLCRGGIAYGKHFVDGTFLFSAGLIAAYRLEQAVARYPRVVVSSDLLSLVAASPADLAGLPLLKEDDGVAFVDFLRGADAEAIRPVIVSLLTLIRHSFLG